MKKEEIRYFMEIAYKEAIKAEKQGEVPVGCLIVCKETKQIISKSYNQTEKLKDPTAHAEILAIRKACKKYNDWRLDSRFIIFTTLEPCRKCLEVIKDARIKEVFYGAKNLSKKKIIKSPRSKNLNIQKIGDQLKNFFKRMR